MAGRVLVQSGVFGKCTPQITRRHRCHTAHLWRACGILDHYRGLQAPTEVVPTAQVGLASLSSEDECPVECVHDIHNLAEFNVWQQKSQPGSLVVVDFYKTSCGACKYIAPGFVKLCRSSNGHSSSVIFLKHNVNQEDDEELSDLAMQYGIKMVPRFLFFKDGECVDNFATRDKTRIATAINELMGAEVVHI